MCLGVGDANDRPRRRRQSAVVDAVVDVVDELLLHCPVHKCPSRHLSGAFVVSLFRRRQQRHVVDGHVRIALGANAARELRATADGAPLVVELP